MSAAPPRTDIQGHKRPGALGQAESGSPRWHRVRSEPVLAECAPLACPVDQYKDADDCEREQEPPASAVDIVQSFFAYSTNYLIDADNGIIVDVEATTAIRQAEVLAAKRMIERAMARFDLYPARLLGDSAYGSAEMLGWLVYEQGIESVGSNAFTDDLPIATIACRLCHLQKSAPLDCKHHGSIALVSQDRAAPLVQVRTSCSSTSLGGTMAHRVPAPAS